MRSPFGTFAIPAFRVALLAAVLMAAGCTSEPKASAFKAASDDDAEAVVRTYLDAAASGDDAKAANSLCDRRSMHLALTSYSIVVVEPAWSGGEPYFRVDVEVGRPDGGKDSLSLSVRAREGCVDRFLGVPTTDRAHLSSGEIAL